MFLFKDNDFTGKTVHPLKLFFQREKVIKLKKRLPGVEPAFVFLRVGCFYLGRLNCNT